MDIHCRFPPHLTLFQDAKMNFWWVNHSQTFRQEFFGKYIWSTAPTWIYMGRMWLAAISQWRDVFLVQGNDHTIPGFTAHASNKRAA
jgi:hypothetical protein